MKLAPQRLHNPEMKITPSLWDAAQPGKESRGGAQVFPILAAGAAAMACLLCLLPATGHDQMWFLSVADRILHGEQLYGPQLLVSNPPLYLWMLLPAVEASRLLHVPATLLYKAVVLLLEAATGTICLRLLRSLHPGAWRLPRGSFAFAFIVLFAVLPVRDFGQREHLLALLCLPYLFCAALPRDSPPFTAVRILIGFAAAVGFALKPQQFLVPAAVEMFLVLRHRNLRSVLRPEPWTILVASLAYLVAIRRLTPEYLGFVVPLLRETYWAIAHLSPVESLLAAVQLHVLAAAALGLYLALRSRRPNPLTEVLLAAGAAATLAYYVQATGWYYQQLPALIFFGAALCSSLADLIGRRALPRWMTPAAALLSGLAVVLTALFSGYTLRDPLNFPSGLSDSPDPMFFANLAPGTPVLMLTTDVDEAAPPIYIHRLRDSQRTNVLWLLPAILRSESSEGAPPRHRLSPAQVVDLDALQHRFMAEDLARGHPALILVERCQDPAVRCQYLEDRHDDVLAWFLRDRAFRAQFAYYRYLRSAGRFDAYVLR